MKEIWVKVDWLDKDYDIEVSNLGDIKKSSTGKIRKLNATKHGYYHILLSNKGKTYAKKVHRLVAQAFIPNIENKRSMIYINNLCEFLRIIVDNCNCGVFFPQNEEYVSIPKLVKLISELHGKKIKFIKVED